MSPLAFDKQGKPFAWHRRTRKLLVRLFRNPAARGTCCQVLDAEGSPLYIDAETDYVELRKAVGNVPGVYRLDQCDDDGVEIDDAQPAYVSIDVTRNAALPGNEDVNPLVIIEHLVAIQADVMKTMAAQQAALISASAEILRAPYRPPPPPPERAKDKDDEEDDNEDEDELDSDEPTDPWATWRPLVDMVEPHLPKLGEFLYHQFVAFLKQSATPSVSPATTPPAAAPASSPTPAPAPAAAISAPSPVAWPQGAAAGQSAPASSSVSGASAAAPASSTEQAEATAGALTSTSSDEPATKLGQHDVVSEDDADVAVGQTPPANMPAPAATARDPIAPPDSTSASAPASPAPTTSPASTALAAPSTEPPRNALPTPTPRQMAHLFAIRTRLSDAERAIAENAIRRMTPDVLLQWLAELSAMSVDDAVRTIRQMIARIRSAAPPTRR